MISPELCIKCKGKLLCGLKKCPILEKNSKQTKIVSAIKGDSFYGSSPPGLFVSWQNYPKVGIAPLSALPEEISEISDSPEKWYGVDQEKIISFRESLLRSYKSMPVSQASNPNHELLDFQELAMAEKNFEVQINLSSKPKTETKFDSFSAPMGPSAKLDKINLIENPRVPKKLDYYASDTDAKSNTALINLFEAGFPVSTLSKVLSSGALGVKKNRKLVPTRWSIVATLDNIGKHIIDKIKEYSVIDSVQVFEDTYLDNHFIIMLLPKPWSFEQLEVWVPGSIWNMEKDSSKIKIYHDHEMFEGMKGYANEVTGAYYAVRLPIVEYLREKKKQAMVVVFREIGDGYKLPLGSWVCGETTKAAMKKQPKVFSNAELALEFIGKRLKVPIKKWKKESVVLDYYNKQKTLFDF